MSLGRLRWAIAEGDDVPGHVEDAGEVNWLVDDALRLEVPIPVIALAVMQLLVSRDRRKPWARAVALMRHGFGGHPFGPDPDIAHERAVGRVGAAPEVSSATAPSGTR